jgi:two-component system, sensor histidine kinase and response regulator
MKDIPHSSPPSARTAREPLAESALARLRSLGGEAVVRRIFSIVLEQVPERLAIAQQGLASGDLEAIRHTAHSLRSSAANVGATRLQELARELEENLVQGNESEAAPGLARLIATWELVREQLLEHLET